MLTSACTLTFWYPSQLVFLKLILLCHHRFLLFVRFILNVTIIPLFCVLPIESFYLLPSLSTWMYTLFSWIHTSCYAHWTQEHHNYHKDIIRSPVALSYKLDSSEIMQLFPQCFSMLCSPPHPIAHKVWLLSLSLHKEAMWDTRNIGHKHLLSE